MGATGGGGKQSDPAKGGTKGCGSGNPQGLQPADKNLQLL